MKKTIAIITFLSLQLTFAQTKLQNEKMDGNKITTMFKTNLNYSVKKENNKNVFFVKDYADESAPGDVSLPSNDVFISLPVVDNPQVNFSIVSKKKINAIPKFNDVVELTENKELKYSKATVLKNSKTSHFKVKGYLWIKNNYCLHIQVVPAIFLSSQNVIELVEDFKVELTFRKNLPATNQLRKRSNTVKFIANSNYEIKNVRNKFKIKSMDSWIDYSKQYVKIGTASNGIYRVKKTDLENLGVSTATINPKTFQLFLKGKEVPLFVNGEADLSFDVNDYIEFVGLRNMGGHHRGLSGYDTPYNEYLGRYTDTTVYWLTWGAIDGKRVEISNGTELPSADTLDYYTQREHYERNLWFDFSCSSVTRREEPFWIENKTWVEGQLRVKVGSAVSKVSKNFNLTNIVPNKTATILVKLQDYAANVSYKAHLLALRLNNTGDYYDSTYVNKYQKVILSTNINSDLLKDGNNTLQVYSFKTSAVVNSCATDWYEIEYPRYLSPVNDSLNFIFPYVSSVAPKTIQLQDISTNSFAVWKYRDGYKKYNLSKSGNKVVFTDTVSATSAFCFVDETHINSPKFYYAKQFVNLRNSNNKADYIAITHKKFKTKVNEYVTFISQNYGLSTKIVDIDDIYDEYSYGFFNPEVIKDFLKSTHSNWQAPKPEYVVLIGGATYDYHGNKFKYLSKARVICYVPSFGGPVSDNWFVTWDTTGAYIPQMNIGRIPVTTNEELDWYSEKHRNYISQKYDEWNKKYIFFSGGNEKNPSEIKTMYSSNQYVIDNFATNKPTGGKAEHFYKTVTPKTDFGPYSREYIQDVINNGAVFISYLGHSGTETWDNSIVDPAQLKNNSGRYPMISDFGCSTGKFAEPDVTSFSELFTIGNDGQALTYVGNASLGFVSTSVLMPKLFYKKIFKENVHIVSRAHKEAKIEMISTYGSSGIYKLFTLTNTLIGDPLITLPIPTKSNFAVKDNGIILASDLLTDLQDSVGVTIHFNNYGVVTSDTLSVLTIHQFQTVTDSVYSTIEIPNFADSIKIRFSIKNMAGNHSVKVVLDPNNEYDEILEDDNNAQTTFNVASSSIRPLLQYQIINGMRDTLVLLNPSLKLNEEKIILDISKDSEFNNLVSNEIQFDSLTTIFDITNLEQDTRYWFRARVKGNNNYTTTFSFIHDSNSSKYYLVDSLSVVKTSTVNIGIKKNGIRIDTTKIKFIVMSAGHDDGNTVLITKNDINHVDDTTLRGHYVSLFDDSTYSFIKSLLFDVNGEGAPALNRYNTFLDTVSSNYLVLFAIKDEGSYNLSNEIRNKIKTFGSTLIDSLSTSDSWAFIGKRGATPGSMPEAYSKSGSGSVTIDTTISFLSKNGNMLTSEIGPTSKWDKLVVSQEIPSNSAITYTPIGIKADGVLDTLAQLSFQDSVADLSHISSSIYSSMRILADFTVSDDKQSPILKSLGVDYTDVAELAINYQVVSVEKDSIMQGEKNKLSFTLYNVGETKADSVTVKVELQKPDNSSLLLEKFVTAIDSSSNKKIEFDFEILNSFGFGNMSYSISVDTENKITEFFEDNNFFQIPFYVKKDTSTGINDFKLEEITFDGVEILDWSGGDFVSNTPTIAFKLSDKPNRSIASIRLDNKLLDGGSYDYDTINKIYKLKPEESLKNGKHTIDFSIPKPGVANEKVDTLIIFTVSNELKAVDIYNYPNPAKEKTHFTFRLAKLPESLDIKIYTVAGRLIKILEFPSYDLRVGINKKEWDLRDQDGDKIANGVYLYKVILKDKEEAKYYIKKLAIVK